MILGIPALAFAWLTLVALQRVAELWLSRANLAATPGAASAPRAGGGVAWSLMIALHVVAIAAPAVEIALTQRRAPPALAAAMLVLFAAAQALRFWTMATLGRAWNARAVVASENAIVTHGPYRWIRHPNYLALLIELSAVPLEIGAWISWVVVNALHAPILAHRIRREEALLALRPGWSDSFRNRPRFVALSRMSRPRSEPRP